MYPRNGTGVRIPPPALTFNLRSNSMKKEIKMEIVEDVIPDKFHPGQLILRSQIFDRDTGKLLETKFFRSPFNIAKDKEH